MDAWNVFPIKPEIIKNIVIYNSNIISINIAHNLKKEYFSYWDFKTVTEFLCISVSTFTLKLSNWDYVLLCTPRVLKIALVSNAGRKIDLRKKGALLHENVRDPKGISPQDWPVEFTKRKIKLFTVSWYLGFYRDIGHKFPIWHFYILRKPRVGKLLAQSHFTNNWKINDVKSDLWIKLQWVSH